MHLEPRGPLPSVEGLSGFLAKYIAGEVHILCRPRTLLLACRCHNPLRRRRRAFDSDQGRPSSRFAGPHILHFVLLITIVRLVGSCTQDCQLTGRFSVCAAASAQRNVVRLDEGPVLEH